VSGRPEATAEAWLGVVAGPCKAAGRDAGRGQLVAHNDGGSRRAPSALPGRPSRRQLWSGSMCHLPMFAGLFVALALMGPAAAFLVALPMTRAPTGVCVCVCTRARAYVGTLSM